MSIIKINLSKKEDYYSQLNNAKYPLSSCGVTSMINALAASRIPFAVPAKFSKMQPEDYLTQMLETQEARKMAEKLAPHLVNKYPPRLIHVMLQWAVNRFVGYEADTFTMESSIQAMIYHIWANECAVVMDGKFTPQGHIICVVGFEYEANTPSWFPKSYSDIRLERIVNIIVDDSYGNFNTKYWDHKGNDIELSLETFNNYTNELSNPFKKRMHIFRRQV